MLYRRKPRTRTTYVLLVVNIVLYTTSVLHWIATSTMILGHPEEPYSSMDKAQQLIIVSSPGINVRMPCSFPRCHSNL